VQIVLQVEEDHVYKKTYHLIGWGFPFIQTLIPLIFNKFGLENPVWCWMRETKHNLWQFLFLYGEMGLCSLVGMALWFKTLHTARILHQQAVVRNTQTFVEPFLVKHMLFVVLGVGVFIVLVTNRIYLTAGGDPSFALYLTFTLALSSQGLIPFLVFGLSLSNFKEWVMFFKRWRPIIRKRARGQEEILVFEAEDSPSEYD